MVCLPTWAPGVKEQDKLKLRRLAQGQGVAADGRIRGGGDGQGQHVSGGTGDGSAPGGSVDAGRQTKGGPGSILVMGLRTYM